MDAAGGFGVKRRKVLITGAGGFCGQLACRRFVDRGYAVAAAVRGGSAASGGRSGGSGSAGSSDLLARMGAKLERCELTDRQAVGAMLERVQPDYVLHLAGLNAAGPSWTDPAAYLESNAMATVYLLEAVRALDRPCRILVAGSMLRYDWPSGDMPPKPPHPYSLSKTMQVLLARSWHSLYGVDVMVAEPGNLIGPGPSTGICALIASHVRRLSEAAEQGAPRPAPFRLSSYAERRDYLDARDAVAAYELLLEQGEAGQVYPIASGRFRTLREVAEAFERAAGTAIEWEVGQSVAGSPEPVDLTAISALGWRPSIPFEQSIADMLARGDAG